ncbi:MAG: cobyric acid synthase [Thermodesulfovibrionales bacterium]
MAKALMVQGTGSGAGKSLIAAALCRIFKEKGINVAPFKAQNMALNSAITIEGGEIGRAQVLQAEAAGVEPTVDMNPILLKASGEMGSQVVIQGKVHSCMKAQEYYAFKQEAWKAVQASWRRLSRKHELIILEGAGSPAEINLMDVDIVNMAAARLAKAPVLLVGDIDKGGVFASLYGTVKLLGRDSKLIKGFIINKFRGDLAILAPGLDMIRLKTGTPVLGVLPYIRDIGLPEEDGLALQRLTTEYTAHRAEIRVVVVRLRYISNFTDFDPLFHEPDVEVLFSRNPADIENADLVIVPGSKNTVKDLLDLRERGLDGSIRRAYEKGAQVIGMCGGYQMLGEKILDPDGVESPHREMEGIGLLRIETVFGHEKVTCRSEATVSHAPWLAEYGVAQGASLEGYEIHMGESSGELGLFRVKRHSGPRRSTRDGSRNGNCWGTYLHGIFDNDAFRRGVVNDLRRRKGLSPIDSGVNYQALKEQALDRLAATVRDNLDMKFIEGLIGL